MSIVAKSMVKEPSALAEPPKALPPISRNIRRLRLRDHRSQAEMAACLRRIGTELGEPNACGKRLVQKWEMGEHKKIRPNYQRALEVMFGISYERLCELWQDTDFEYVGWSDAESLAMVIRSTQALLKSVVDRIADSGARSAGRLRSQRIRSYRVRQ